MTDTTYPVAESYARTSRITREQYLARYEASIRDPERYWSEQAACVDWLTPFSSARDTSFAKADFRIRWYADGALNVSANCLDRHLAARGDKTALIWEGDNPDQSRRISYRELHDKVCRFANALKAEGVTKGDRVVIYMPMIPEAAVAMLACTRIGAVHCVVFGGFSPESIASRIEDSAARLVITAQHSARGGKRVPLKANVDEALTLPGTESVTTVITVDLEGGESQRRELDFNTLLDSQSADCPPEPMNAEDPLFILYTSGSTGKPKGVLHTTGGYLVYVTSSFRDVFDIREDDVYWCTADVGWITGHSYLLYGPLSNGSTSLMFEGVPQYPDWGRFGKVIDKHQVTVFYTAPTAIRSLIREGNHHLAQSQRRSLRLLGSVGEPINPEAWNWYYHTFGEARCPIVDTWWQTETGGILISPLPGATDTKPGSATLPLFGVEPALVDNEGVLLEGEAEGNLVLLNSWPGQMRTVYGDDQRFFDTYFSTFSGMYFTGDGARRDADGYYWITGRVDDVLNVSGHRLGTAEIESALVGHDGVAESAAVGMPHEIKGQGICIFVTLQTGIEPTDALKAELMALVRKTLGPIATPDAIHWAPALPKTRSGKIMRRILRKIAANELDTLGDTSTLSDPQVVDQLIKTVYG